MNDTLNTLSQTAMRRAHDILLRSGIREAWQAEGAEVRLVGSLRMGLMMKHRDIDLHIYSRPLRLDRSFAAMARIAARPETGRIECRNLIDTEERCVEWHAQWIEPDGEEWTIDMIHIEAGSRYDGYFERMADRIAECLTPDMRTAVLRLKYRMPDTLKIMGVEYYRAVIEGGVRDWAEFMRWRDAHPADGIMEWIP